MRPWSRRIPPVSRRTDESSKTECSNVCCGRLDTFVKFSFLSHRTTCGGPLASPSWSQRAVVSRHISRGGGYRGKIVPDLFYKFMDTQKYASQQEIAGEATARLPYAVFAPAIITHFPLFHRSQDHELIGRGQESGIFRRRHGQIHEFLLNSFEEKFPITKLDLLIKEFSDELDSAFVSRATKEIWGCCRGALMQISDKHPEFFVFNAKTLIDLEVNRRVHDQVVKAGILKTTPWHTEEMRGQAYDLTNDVLFIFLGILNKLLDEAVNLEFEREQAEDVSKHGLKGLGGVISWFNALDKLDEPGGKIANTKYDTRKFYDIGKHRQLNECEAVMDRYLVWRRGDRNWRYTFYEGIFNYPHSPNDECVAELRQFLKKLLLSKKLVESFPEPVAIEGNRLASKYPFPGFRVAGAQYFVLPVELLVLISACLRRLPSDLRKYLLTDVPFTSTGSKRNITGALQDLYALDEAHLGRESSIRHIVTAVMPKIEIDLIETIIMPKIESDPIEIGGNFIRHCALLRERIDALHEKLVGSRLHQEAPLTTEQEKFYLLFAALAELLWKCIYSEKEKYSIGQDDFVSSIVLDGKAIYFSNFRPYEDSDFTRTFFIDFALAPYQRARLIRRLCEIATYRMSCVKDLHLFRALQDGISHLNQRFNERFFEIIGTGMHFPPKEADADRVLRSAVGLYRRATQFDMFIAEGISGRRRAAEGDLERVRRQVRDLREKRLSGYAQLSDFLERGLAVSVMEISQVADRYENLIARIRDLMSTIRTAVGWAQTVRIVNTTRQIRRDSSVQIFILWAALIVSWLSVSEIMDHAFSGREGTHTWYYVAAFGILLFLLMSTTVAFWPRIQSWGVWHASRHDADDPN
jgi:hypothetical protein